MLGLVDYSDASSDEDDEQIEEPEVTDKIAVQSKKLILPPAKASSSTNGDMQISDDDEALNESITTEALIHSKLPPPKHQTKVQKPSTVPVEEEDDEFLKKKAVPSEPPPKPKPIKGPVRITIPSLSDFKDEEMDIEKVGNTSGTSNKGSGLLRMLPQPKTERSFTTDASKKANESGTNTSIKKVTSLIPDSVKKRQEALKKGIPVPGSGNKKGTKVTPITQESDDDDDDNETGASDFFSLEKKEKLPTISSNEITLMVAKRAAEMAQAKSKVDDAIFGQPDQDMEEDEPEEALVPQYSSIDETAVRQLIGGNKAKRAKLSEDVNIIEISDADIMPNREEFRRTQLTRQTQFIPTGKLEGYDATGKRNSQITKLAQRAVANEQELEAMWAANRQNKRAASSKYGF